MLIMEQPGPGSATPGYWATGLAAVLCRKIAPIMDRIGNSPMHP